MSQEDELDTQFIVQSTYSGANPFNIPAVRRVPNGGKKHLFGIRLFA